MKLAALIVSGLLMSQPANAACMLEPNDFVALKQSKSHIQDQVQVDALNDAKQSLLCDTRAFWRAVHANHDQLNGPPSDNYSPYYLSPDEYKIITPLYDAWLQAQLNKQPAGNDGK